MKFGIGMGILRAKYGGNHLGSGGGGDGRVEGGFAADKQVVVVGENSEKAGIGGFVEGRGAMREEAGRGRRRKGIGNTGVGGFGPENIVLVELLEDVVRVGVGLFKETHEADVGRRR